MYYNPELSYPVPVSPTWGIQDGSKIKAYQECARKYFYEYVLGWRSTYPSNHLIFGSAWHEALAHLYDNGFTAEDANVAFRDLFLPYYRQFIDPGDDDLYHPKTPERALLALAYYAAVHRHDLSENDILEYDGKKLIEIGGQVSISNEYTVAFKQDTIMKNNRGIDVPSAMAPYSIEYLSTPVSRPAANGRGRDGELPGAGDPFHAN